MPGPFWSLDSTLDFLNHGSFGACPAPVLEAQAEFRRQLERDPVVFFRETYPARLDAARSRLASFLGARPADLAFVTNATTGVATVLASAPLEPGDRVLTTDHAYPACAKALRHFARLRGFVPDVARIPLPVAGPEEVVERIVGAITPETKLAMVSHVTSPTALVFPLAAIVDALRQRGVDVLVDGAHSAGQIPMDLSSLGAAYFTGNAHKWLCAPKGAAFLVVRPDRRRSIAPLVPSHFIEAPRADRFPLAFDWTGTFDPTAILSIPAALDALEHAVDGGLTQLMARNHALAVEARTLLLRALDEVPPAPEGMLGSMAAIPLPDANVRAESRSGPFEPSPLETRLAAAGFRVPVITWPEAPRRWLRISAQAYNHRAQYERLANVVRDLLVADV